MESVHNNDINFSSSLLADSALSQERGFDISDKWQILLV